jgi:hypothetical protein
MVMGLKTLSIPKFVTKCNSKACSLALITKEDMKD